ncbi:NUDIX domain-containing protein [Macrococcus equipercicus]|uniref:NUDIX domain-containing protein n=1 Tax=Macrococcus equipercicus TaxID=69967 RepID=A0ABQ6R9F3_9STAP|nr:NUDIX domain-containing protein [Macrococcus equipercicus]KAA1039931.1 NUDIX domain-containing protein [Macrococcus equipercicus]
MNKYVCANLVNIVDDKILLVKVRENEKYYLPGGKIEKGENDIQALIREIKEELSVTLEENKITYLDTITAPAYPDNENQVELRCYIYENLEKIIKSNEITDIQYIDMAKENLIAPAVNILIKKRFRKFISIDK